MVASRPMSSLIIRRIFGGDDVPSPAVPGSFAGAGSRLTHPAIRAASKANPLNVIMAVLWITVSFPPLHGYFYSPVTDTFIPVSCQFQFC